MNDFDYFADAHRDANKSVDLIALSLRLASTPSGPLYGSHISPTAKSSPTSTRHPS